MLGLDLLHCARDFLGREFTLVGRGSLCRVQGDQAGLNLRRFFGVVLVSGVALTKRATDELPDGLYGFDREVDDPVDGFVDRGLGLFDGLLDGATDVAEAEQAGEEDDGDGPGAEIGVGKTKDLENDADNALEVEVLWELQAGATESAKDPVHETLFQMSANIVFEVLEAEHDAGNQVAEETDGIGNNVHDDVGGLGENAEEHVFEGEDFLDKTDGGVVDALPEGLVFLAKFLLHCGHALIGGFVLLGEFIDEGIAMLVYLRIHGVKVCRNLMKGLLAELLDALVEALHEVFDFGARVGDAFFCGLEAGIYEIGDVVDGDVHLMEILDARLAEGILDEFFPIAAPGG